MTHTFAERRQEINRDPERRARIEGHKAAMELALQLVELRESVGLTQTEVARRLGVGQGRISRLERAEDLRLSTLNGYVTALGGELEIRAKLPKTKAIDLIASD